MLPATFIIQTGPHLLLVFLLYYLSFSKLNMLSCQQILGCNDILLTSMENWVSSARYYASWKFQSRNIRSPGMSDRWRVRIAARTFQRDAETPAHSLTTPTSLTLYLPTCSLTALLGSPATSLPPQSTDWAQTTLGRPLISLREVVLSTRSYTQWRVYSATHYLW